MLESLGGPRGEVSSLNTLFTFILWPVGRRSFIPRGGWGSSMAVPKMLFSGKALRNSRDWLGNRKRVGIKEMQDNALLPQSSAPRGFWFFFLINLFIYLFLFLPALGLRCRARAFSSCSEQGLLFIAVRGLLIAVASLVAEHGLPVHGLQ